MATLRNVLASRDTVRTCSSHASPKPCPRPRRRFPAVRAQCRSPSGTSCSTRRSSRRSRRGSRRPIFGMGCFWGAERLFWQLPGVYTTAVGYAGGTPRTRATRRRARGAPATRRLCSSPSTRPGSRTTSCCRTFWEGHDPTQGMRQGNDVGSQYRSALYWTTDAQQESALASKARYAMALAQAGHGTDHDRARRGRDRSTTPRPTTSSTWRGIRAATAESAAPESAARSARASQAENANLRSRSTRRAGQRVPTHGA